MHRVQQSQQVWQQCYVMKQVEAVNVTPLLGVSQWRGCGTSCQTDRGVLGVSGTADKKEIKAAYFSKAKQLHPDMSADGDKTEFLRLNQAYRRLMAESCFTEAAARPRSRGLYNQQTRYGPHQQGRVWDEQASGYRVNYEQRPPDPDLSRKQIELLRLAFRQAFVMVILLQIVLMLFPLKQEPSSSPCSCALCKSRSL